MTFNGKELAAMLKMAISMANVDGEFAETEKAAIALEISNFGVNQEQLPGLLAVAGALDASDAFSILNSMTPSQQKYVTSFLAVVMASDGKVKDSEVELWKLICTLGNFPTMKFTEALEFWRNN